MVIHCLLANVCSFRGKVCAVIYLFLFAEDFSAKHAVLVTLGSVMLGYWMSYLSWSSMNKELSLMVA